MNKNKKTVTVGVYIIASAIIWGMTLVGCALKLSGTDCYEQISTILILGAALHLILIWGPLAARMKKLRGGNSGSSSGE